MLQRLKISPALIGTFLVTIGLVSLIFNFLPVATTEVSYQIDRLSPPANNHEEIAPKSTEFGLIIPKINVNSPVIKNVNYRDPAQYQIALSKGIAHAFGTALPGEIGNIFLFSHSSVNFLLATRYNSIFYLLSKLEKGDELKLFYQGVPFSYQVTEKKIVSKDALSYLKKHNDLDQNLTLMTCWPPGTDIGRLLVIGKLVENTPSKN